MGPGPGYFSVEIARSVPQGRLELFDIQREMLQKARGKLRRAGVTNVGFTQGSGAALPFKSGVFDVAFLVAVLGEVSDPAACVHAIARTLRPRALLSISEIPGDPDALSEADVRAPAEAAGLQWVETFPIRRGFTLNFRKP